MNTWKFYATGVIVWSCVLLSCSGQGKQSAQTAVASPLPSKEVLGDFNADSAYRYIADQVAFGARVPGTPAHDATRDYIVSKLRSLADTMMIQEGVVENYLGEKVQISNIIAGFRPDVPRRIVLAAHWDTRPWADQSKDAEDRAMPVPGANDGGSGVGVLLEIARQLAQKPARVGVDLIFFDAEDSGKSGGFDTAEETWCLGSQYWADHMVPYTADNLPVYGILLDMVGGANAKFYYDLFSTQNAQNACVKVWSEAEALGLVDMFPRTVGGVITDDHVFMTRAGIPTTVIIELNNAETSTFPPYWHTTDDTMENISRTTLQGVGDVVLNVVYKEKQF